MSIGENKLTNEFPPNREPSSYHIKNKPSQYLFKPHHQNKTISKTAALKALKNELIILR